MMHDDNEAEIIVGTKRFYRHSNAEAIEFASSLPEPVRWQVRLKTGRVVDSEHYRQQKADETERTR